MSKETVMKLVLKHCRKSGVLMCWAR